MEVYYSDGEFKRSIRDIQKTNNRKTLKKNKSTLISVTTNSKKRLTKKVFQDFSESSSIHGVKYLGTQNIVKSYMGKLFWLVIMVSGFFGVNIMLRIYWDYMKQNPAILRIETFYKPIINAPFPAITICPIVPTMLKTRLNLMKNIKLPVNVSTEDAMFFIKYGMDVSDPSIAKNPKRLNKFIAFLKANQWTLNDFLKTLHPCEDIIESCWWHGLKINCTDYIKQSYSYDGVCCSYNYYLEYLMKHNIRFQEVPVLHTVKTGSKSGLTIIFNRDLFLEENKTDSINFVNSIKVLVFVHHTLSYPNAETALFTLEKGQGLKVGVQPIIKKKQPNIYHTIFNGILQPECISNSQKSNLRFFSEYQQTNCYVDCAINDIYKMCGCIMFIHAPMANYTSLPLCELEDSKCLNEYWDNAKIINYDTCFCSNLCKDTIYQISISKYYLKYSQFSVSPRNQRLTSTHAFFNVYWKTDFFTVFLVEPSYIDWKNLAEIGGIFSLFLGCSILSAVEIIYFVYLLFRTICSKQKKNL